MGTIRTAMFALFFCLRAGASQAETAEPPPPTQNPAALDAIDRAFGDYFVNPLASVLFFDVIFWDNTLAPDALVGTTTAAGGRVVAHVDSDRFQVEPPGGGEALEQTLSLANPRGTTLPFIVLWLVCGALFFTLRMRFINLRGFVHAINVTRGRYDDDSAPGEISHFQALSSALSATVGLGNIAGVAIAVKMGGPGAVFWMVFAGFLGMTSKFAECTLGQMYRRLDDSGSVSGGPMHYLYDGLREIGWPRLGKALSLGFMIMCVGGSFGGGNMFQANQAFQAAAERFPVLADKGWLFGIVLAASVGVVIMGGIRRIAAAAGILVPMMCGIYVLAGAWILLSNVTLLPSAVGAIVGGALTADAGLGGLIGTLVIGFQRSAFSNEAGVGSAAIAHSAASTKEPVREGIVALLEPFIDTIIVCAMTGLVVVVTGAYQQDVGDGVLMTSSAFGSVISWFPWVLSLAVLLFAFSTMISWSYYGERCATLLFGQKATQPYRFVFIVFTFFGCIFQLGNVVTFSDLMILGMAFPNILGVAMLSSKIKAALDHYWERYQQGAFVPLSRAASGPKA